MKSREDREEQQTSHTHRNYVWRIHTRQKVQKTVFFRVPQEISLDETCNLQGSDGSVPWRDVMNYFHVECPDLIRHFTSCDFRNLSTDEMRDDLSELSPQRFVSQQSTFKQTLSKQESDHNKTPSPHQFSSRFGSLTFQVTHI